MWKAKENPTITQKEDSRHSRGFRGFRDSSSEETPSFVITPCFANPPTWQRSRNRLKRSKMSLRESLWGSLRGPWPTPQNESKTSLLETPRVKNHLFFDSNLIFDSFWGVAQDPRRFPQRLSQRLILTPLPGRGVATLVPFPKVSRVIMTLQCCRKLSSTHM